MGEYAAYHPRRLRRGVGGADSVRVRRFDDAIPGGLGAVSPAFAARIARNTQLLLIEESHVARVLDPGGGSWFIEDLTESLAQQAWSLFTEIEAGEALKPPPS